MLALVPLLVAPAVAAATAILCLLLLMAINEWWLPQQPDETTPRFHYFTRMVHWSKRKLRGALLAARKRLAHSLSHAVAARSHGVVVALNNFTELGARLGDAAEAEAKQTYQALYALRHVTMPAYVTGYVRPVITTANTALATAQAVSTTLTNVSIEIADGLRALPWGVPAGLPQRVATLMVTYKRLWDKVWSDLSPKVDQLWRTIVPELRQRIEALERGAARGLGQLVQELRRDVDALEQWRQTVVMPRLNAMQQAIDALSEEVFGPVAGGLVGLLERLNALEELVLNIVQPRIDALEELVLQLRTELEEGVLTGLEAFRQRIEVLEREVLELIPLRLEAMQLAIDTLAAEIFDEVGAGLTALTTRLVELEQYVFGELRPLLDLTIGRIEALEADIANNILPRLRAIEELLVPAALAALVLEALRIAAPNLFCNNVTNATRALCADDEAFWNALLAGLVVFAIALNPREIAAAGAALTGALGGVIAETVDH